MAEKRVTAASLRKMKEDGQPITMLTAYDHPTAAIMDQAGTDVLLVGDSLGMVVMGYDTTLPVTMEDMLHHVRMVTRATKRALVVADMPFMSYQISPTQAAENAGRFVQEAGAPTVKLEGGPAEFGPAVEAITRCGIPVMGHIGFTPQSINQIGGYKIAGKDPDAAAKLVEQAQGLEQLGCFSIVIECVPTEVGKAITEAVSIPTIGIGAGKYCDGQVLVWADMAGMFEGFQTKFVKRYANMAEVLRNACESYIDEVRSGEFPGDTYAYS